MSKTIALIGHCGPDSSYLRLTVSRAARDAKVVIVSEQAELDRLLDQGVDLLLLNRVLDWGFEHTEGVQMIRALRARHPELKMILVSNYPEAQAAALAAGALPGFGKRELGSPHVVDAIRQALESESSPKSIANTATS